MQNNSQSLASSPSLLSAVTSVQVFLDSVEYGATRYCETMYLHQTNILNYESGDGMNCHGWFNRGFAEKLALSARRSQRKIKFVPKKEKGVIYIGDVVIATKHIGQRRFDVTMDKKTYQLLHMTGTIDEVERTLTVYDIGKARTEYLKFQSSRVNISETPNLFTVDPNGYNLVVDDDKPTRIILVTQVSQLRDKVTVWACIPTAQFDSKTCVIQLAELEKICEKPVTGKRPSFIVTPKKQNNRGHGINVTRKRVA